MIVGIGLNLNQNRFPDEIKDTATSLRLVNKKKVKKKKILKKIVDEFYNFYNDYYNKSKYQKILSEWERYCDTIGKGIIASTRKEELRGKVIGVDKECRLLLKLKKGRVIKVLEGDVKVMELKEQINK